MRAVGTRGRGIFPKALRPLLDAEQPSRLWPSFRAFCERASAADLISAFEASRNEATKVAIVIAIGERGLDGALPLLVRALWDRSLSVREFAAESLAKVGDPRCGPDLVRKYREERGLRLLVAIALGAVGYRPAIPLLIDALCDEDGMVRGGAAWSLGHMGAVEARTALEVALRREQHGYARDRMCQALYELPAPLG
jgi:HEAT repeat protein